MGSAFSASVDVSGACWGQLEHVECFEAWSPTLAALGAARAAALASERGVLLRSLTLTRAEFHSVFCDYTAMLHALAALHDDATASAAASRAAAAASGPSPSPPHVDADAPSFSPTVAATLLADASERFRGLRTDMFELFLPRVGIEEACGLPALLLPAQGTVPTPAPARRQLATVRAVDVLTAIVLCCSGSTLHRAEVLWHIFGDDAGVWRRPLAELPWLAAGDPFTSLRCFAPGPQLSVAQAHDALCTVVTVLRRLGLAAATTGGGAGGSDDVAAGGGAAPLRRVDVAAATAALRAVPIDAAAAEDDAAAAAAAGTRAAPLRLRLAAAFTAAAGAPNGIPVVDGCADDDARPASGGGGGAPPSAPVAAVVVTTPIAKVPASTSAPDGEPDERVSARTPRGVPPASAGVRPQLLSAGEVICAPALGSGTDGRGTPLLSPSVDSPHPRAGNVSGDGGSRGTGDTDTPPEGPSPPPPAHLAVVTSPPSPRQRLLHRVSSSLLLGRDSPPLPAGASGVGGGDANLAAATAIALRRAEEWAAAMAAAGGIGDDAPGGGGIVVLGAVLAADDVASHAPLGHRLASLLAGRARGAHAALIAALHAAASGGSAHTARGSDGRSAGGSSSATTSNVGARHTLVTPHAVPAVSSRPPSGFARGGVAAAAPAAAANPLTSTRPPVRPPSASSTSRPLASTRAPPSDGGAAATTARELAAEGSARQSGLRIARPLSSPSHASPGGPPAFSGSGSGGGGAHGASPSPPPLSDAAWALGLAVSLLEPPERWRRLLPQRRRALAAGTGGKVLKAAALAIEYAAFAERRVTQLANDALEEGRAAEAVRALLASRGLVGVAMETETATPPIDGRAQAATQSLSEFAASSVASPSGRNPGHQRAVATRAPIGGGGGGSSSGRTASVRGMENGGSVTAAATSGGGGVMADGDAPRSAPPRGAFTRMRRLPSGLVLNMREAHAVTHAAAVDDGATLASAAGAAESAAAAVSGLLAVPIISIHTFLTWATAHPLPRLLLRVLRVPLGRVGSLDRLDRSAPAASREVERRRRGGAGAGWDAALATAAETKARAERALSHFIAVTSLSLADARALQVALTAAAADGAPRRGGRGSATVSWHTWSRVVGDYLLALGERERARAARRMSSAGLPGYVRLKLAAREALLRRVFALYCTAESGGDASGADDDSTAGDGGDGGGGGDEHDASGVRLDVGAFTAGVTRLLRGAAVEKLAAVFAAFDADADGTLSRAALAAFALAIMAANGEAGAGGATAVQSAGSAASMAMMGAAARRKQLQDMERMQGDREFAEEVADSIIAAADAAVVGVDDGDAASVASAPAGDGVTLVGLVSALTAEPALFECFAVAMGLPVDGLAGAAAIVRAQSAGGGSAEDGDGAAGRGAATFDFTLLRTIRDKYSIDITKGRGTAGAPSAGAAGPAGGACGGGGGSRASSADTPRTTATAATTTAPGAAGASAGAGADRYTILGRAVDRAAFRKVLRDLWACPDDALFLADRVFDHMDDDGSGSIDVRELYRGISGALRGPMLDRARYFYALFDVAGEGHMRTDEVLRMLLASNGGGGGGGDGVVSEEDARRVLAAIDTDGSGTVEEDEFLAAVEANPGILDALARVFGRSGTASAASMFATAPQRDSHEGDDVTADGGGAADADAAARGGASTSAAGSGGDGGGVTTAHASRAAPSSARGSSSSSSSGGGSGGESGRARAPTPSLRVQRLAVAHSAASGEHGFGWQGAVVSARLHTADSNPRAPAATLVTGIVTRPASRVQSAAAARPWRAISALHTGSHPAPAAARADVLASTTAGRGGSEPVDGGGGGAGTALPEGVGGGGGSGNGGRDASSPADDAATALRYALAAGVASLLLQRQGAGAAAAARRSAAARSASPSARRRFWVSAPPPLPQAVPAAFDDSVPRVGRRESSSRSSSPRRPATTAATTRGGAAVVDGGALLRAPAPQSSRRPATAPVTAAPVTAVGGRGAAPASAHRRPRLLEPVWSDGEGGERWYRRDPAVAGLIAKVKAAQAALPMATRELQRERSVARSATRSLQLALHASHAAAASTVAATARAIRGAAIRREIAIAPDLAPPAKGADAVRGPRPATSSARR